MEESREKYYHPLYWVDEGCWTASTGKAAEETVVVWWSLTASRDPIGKPVGKEKAQAHGRRTSNARY